MEWGSLGRRGRLADLFDDPPLEFVFRAVAVRADLEEAGFVVGSQPSDLRRRKLRSALAYDAGREVGGCAWRHVGVRLEEQAERLVEPELFVESECVHGHGLRILSSRGRNRVAFLLQRVVCLNRHPNFALDHPLRSRAIAISAVASILA
jgi:hypothetical protein